MVDKTLYQKSKYNQLRKTGQTTSYITNDDGTYQAGYPSDVVDNGNNTATIVGLGLTVVIDRSLLPAEHHTTPLVSKGNLSINTGYIIGDVVLISGGVYICRESHTSTGNVATELATYPDAWDRHYFSNETAAPLAYGPTKWADAVLGCAGKKWGGTLDYAGYDDWRCPTIKELQQICDYAQANPILNDLLGLGKNTWSSNTSASATTTALSMNLEVAGVTGFAAKTTALYGLPVRGNAKVHKALGIRPIPTGQTVSYVDFDAGWFSDKMGFLATRYVETGNTVVDLETSLEWIKNVNLIIPTNTPVNENNLITAYKNNWNFNTDYVVGDCANGPTGWNSVNAEKWICLVDHTSHLAYPAWALSTLYTVGTVVREGTGTSWYICNVEHTSRASGTFANDRTANPTYWTRVYPFDLDRATNPTYWLKTLFFLQMSAGVMNTFTLANGIAAVEALEYAGHDDWRVANISELYSLIDISIPNAAMPAAIFPDATNYYINSSTTNPNLTPQNYAVLGTSGAIVVVAKTSPNFLRICRDWRE